MIFYTKAENLILCFVKMFWTYSRILSIPASIYTHVDACALYSLNSIQHPVRAKETDILWPLFVWSNFVGVLTVSSNGFLHLDLLPLHLQVHHFPPPGGSLVKLTRAGRKMSNDIFSGACAETHWPWAWGSWSGCKKEIILGKQTFIKNDQYL